MKIKRYYGNSKIVTKYTQEEWDSLLEKATAGIEEAALVSLESNGIKSSIFLDEDVAEDAALHFAQNDGVEPIRKEDNLITVDGEHEGFEFTVEIRSL